MCSLNLGNLARFHCIIEKSAKSVAERKIFGVNEKFCRKNGWKLAHFGNFPPKIFEITGNTMSETTKNL